MDYPIIETDSYTYTVETFTGTAVVNAPVITMIDATSGVSMTLQVSQVWSPNCTIDGNRILCQLSFSGTLVSSFTTGGTETVWTMPGSGSISGTTIEVKDDGNSWVLHGDTMSSTATSTRVDTPKTGTPVTTRPSISLSLRFTTQLNLKVEAE